MYSFLEMWGESSFGGKGRGTIEFDGDYTARRRPAWLVLLKTLGAGVLVAVGYALMVPALMQWMPPLRAIGIASGVWMIYLGVAFFVRPRPDWNNMGRPFCFGMVDDPFQYSDDVNRSLMGLDQVLGPGRFVAETAVDLATLVGCVEADAPQSEGEESAADESAGEEPAEVFPPPLSPARFEPWLGVNSVESESRTTGL